MGFLSPSDDKELEKRIFRLERNMERRFLQMEESFSIMRNALVRLQKENIELKNDRDFLLEKYREFLRKISVDTGNIVKGVKENIVEPVKQSFEENVALLERVSTEGILTEEQKLENLKKKYSYPLDELFSLVIKKKRVKVSDVAKKFKVHEGKVEQWGKILQNYDLIDVFYTSSGPELRKKS